jgi:protease I
MQAWFWRWLGLISIVLGLTWGAEVAEAKPMARDFRPVVLVVVSPVAYNESELKAVQDGLKAKHARCVIGSTQAREAKGMMQGTVGVEYTLEQVQAENFDGLIIVGGSGAKMYLWFNPELKRLVRGLNKSHRPLGAISIAPAALVYAGVLSGHKASVLPAPETLKLFAQNNVEIVNSEVTVDGNLVTSTTTNGASAVTRAVAQMLPHKTRAVPLAAAKLAMEIKAKPTVVLPGPKPRRAE